MSSLVADLFAGDPAGAAPSVGVELELLAFRSGDGVPAVAAIADSARALADLPHITFEPGGQVELNPPPASTATAAIEGVAALRDEARRRLDRHGIGLLALGLEPWRDSDEVALQMTTDRYRAMDAHYAAIGPNGQAFMRQTASTQIGVGLRPGLDGRRQWSAANLVAPLLAAAFANAPMRRGRPVGHNGTRTAIHALADPARHHLRWIDREPARAYADFVRGARPIGPAFAGAAAEAAHLTTLFPPVRPRGTYLEVRAIDSLDGDDLATAVTLTAALLASPRAAAATLARLPVTEAADRRRWALAAGAGLRDVDVAAEILTLVDVATYEPTDLPAGYLPPDTGALLDALGQRVAEGRAPGDDAVLPAAALLVDQ